ncbi:hypothetical protein [Leptolyngbya sp. 7M]|uniref:hypothetical protein n=1 Tax=Leptolyngbya sp. 7M TaxID=2812896 RepID=UPI001B8D574E|nr:hypothetical protein [Leptolyngbya sp. 7M]QYO65114.1 XisI protein [Leptolyngbya sp. 7M]
MDRVTQYRKIVQDFLLDFAADDPETQLVFDTERDHTSPCMSVGVAITASMVVRCNLTELKAKFGFNTIALKFLLIES